jgi:hypothetical protein
MKPHAIREKNDHGPLFFLVFIPNIRNALFCPPQDLTLTMTTERPDTEIDIIPDENEMSGINVQTFVDQQVSSHVCIL